MLLMRLGGCLRYASFTKRGAPCSDSCCWSSLLDWAAYGWTPLPLCEVIGMLVQLVPPLDAVARVAVVVDMVIPAVAAVLREESLLDEGASRP